ncbi:zinc-ribbon domain-containing protein [Clostridium algoriphilum]|uniref:zinc ribbon domain-containing protein n=1 Tax=Clostridium algoriphilum TaxID=198347 RepID=UPI001CF440BD|nr:zinc-ribbon domain-containing protein [Clostridium algoriphilum]MCB2295468.1 zinc-ribbon domain-containing protein [Clostridium algoriphilum]
MKFCTKCGNEITDEKLFCTYCGNDLRNEYTNDTESVNRNVSLNKTISLNKTEPVKDLDSNIITPVEESTSNIKMSKKSKIIMVLFAVLIIAFIVIIKVGNSLSDPSKVVTRFEKDVASNNASDLATILYSDDTRLKVDSKSIAPLLSYFKSTPTYFNEVVEDLKNDAISPKNIKSLSITSGNTLTLVNVGKRFLIFPKYKINIKPSYVKITSTVKDVTYSINNTKIGKSDTDNSAKEFGPYIPGNYSILANYKGDYVTLSKPYPVDLISSNNGITELSVFDDMSYLNISSDKANAEIYVDGKGTNVKVSEANHFGPIKSSSKIYATYIENGRTLKSEEYTVATGDTELYLSFENATNDLADVQTQLKDLLSNYATYFVMAVNTNSISLIDPYVTYGSSLYKAQQSYIPTTYATGIKEEIISTYITKYNISDDNKSGSITTSEVYNIIAKDGTPSTKTSRFVYTFKYIDSTSSYQLITINKAQ